ncbi:hypothetical protein GCM10023259_009590 [Thermocatellispora tengchongensis]
MSKATVDAYEDIRAGRGVPEIDPNTGKQGIFEGRKPHEKPWTGAKEYLVPGAKGNKHRILEKTLPGGTKVMGWTNDHYETIHPFKSPHFPDSGWR